MSTKNENTEIIISGSAVILKTHAKQQLVSQGTVYSHMYVLRCCFPEM